MKLVYGISRWTNANRAAALHIDDGKGFPLCGGRGRRVLNWEPTEGEPTCDHCKRKAQKNLEKDMFKIQQAYREAWRSRLRPRPQIDSTPVEVKISWE